MTMKQAHHTYRIVLCALVGFVCCFQTVSAEIRTWTSSSGTTIEAELVRVEAGRAVLRSADGKEVAISLSKLSAEDQAFLQSSTKATSTATEPVTPTAVLAPETKTNISAGALFAFQDAQSLAGGLPESIKLRQPDDAKFMLIQYGPKSGEVLYVVLDPPGPQVVADAAYVWSPSLTGFQIPRRVVGKPRTMKDAKAFVMEIPVSTLFGDLGVRGTIQVISGVQEWWLLFVAGNFELVKAGKSSSFQVGGYMNDFAVAMSDMQTAKPIQLLTDFLFRVETHAESGLTSCVFKMGSFNFIPGRNMKNEIVVKIDDEKGNKAEDHKWKVDDDHLLKAGHDTYFMFVPKALKSGTKYTSRATIDLGPIFGVKSSETTFTKQ